MPFINVGEIRKRPSIGSAIGSLLGAVGGYYLGKRLEPLLNPDKAAVQSALEDAMQYVSPYDLVDSVTVEPKYTTVEPSGDDLSSLSVVSGLNVVKTKVKVNKDPILYMSQVFTEAGKRLVDKHNNPTLGMSLLTKGSELYKAYNDMMQTSAQAKYYEAQAKHAEAQAEAITKAMESKEEITPGQTVQIDSITYRVKPNGDLEPVPGIYPSRGGKIVVGGSQYRPETGASKNNDIKNVMSVEDYDEYMRLKQSITNNEKLLRELEMGNKNTIKQYGGRSSLKETMQKATKDIETARARVRSILKKYGLSQTNSTGGAKSTKDDVDYVISGGRIVPR